MSRNLSIDAYFNALAARHVPRFKFAGSSKSDWMNWRESLTPAVIQSLGPLPTKVPLRPEAIAEWDEDGLVKQKLIFDVEEGLAVTAYVFRPRESNAPLPAILCCHGHGLLGKEPVMGNRSTPELAEHVRQMNYDYGLQMAKAGFVTMSIDWRGFGERDDRLKPHHRDLTRGRDLCNLHYLRASILGMTVLGMDVHDGICAIDYLCDQSFVDARRIGVMGLSFGGTMATWLSICDARICATDLMCCSDRFADFGMRDVNFCGSQITPGLYALCDVADLQGLIAPRPLLVEIGIHDECFRIESAMSCFREVEKIYSAAGASEKLHLDLFEGGHRWGGNKSLEFFREHLKTS